METLIIEPRTKSDARFLRNFSKRIGAEVINSEEWMEDACLCAVMEAREDDPCVSLEEGMKILAE